MATPILPPRYQKIQELSTGSMNLIFKAYDREHKQSVIVKIMRGDTSRRDVNRKLQEMFQHEIYLAHNLKHENILSAIDYGPVKLVYPRRLRPVVTQYITYPFMEDGSLYDLIEDSPPWEEWPLEQIGDVVRQAASALHYIHTRYIPYDLLSAPANSGGTTRPLIHRDVKPDNFLVRLVDTPQRKAHIYLGDLGIARTHRVTGDRTGMPFGTFEYMAPEHFEGITVPQSDQYSLAVMAYFLLTGYLPLELPPDAHPRNPRESGEIWYYVHVHVTPVPPKKLRSDLPAGVDDIMMKALSKKVDQRYSTIWEFANTLFYALTGKSRPQLAKDPTVSTTISNPPNIQQQPDPSPLMEQEQLSTKSDPDDIANRPTLIMDQSLQNNNSSSSSDWQSLPIAIVPPYLEQALSASPELLCWSHDGNYLACLFADHPPIVIDRQGKKKFQLKEAGYAACWNPTSYELALSIRSATIDKNRIQVVLVDNATDMKTASSELFVLATFQIPALYGLDWSTRGKLAVWVSEEHLIYIYAPRHPYASTKSPENTLSVPNLSCGGWGTLRWSHDGSLLVAGGREGEICCWQAGTYARVWSYSLPGKRIFHLAWSSDSTLLAIALSDRSVVVLNILERRIVMEWKNLPVVPRVLSISPKRWLAVASNQSDLYLGNIDTDLSLPAMKFRGHRLVAWSPKRPEFATLHPKNDSWLILYRM
jgi:serine/threonine protein kinase